MAAGRLTAVVVAVWLAATGVAACGDDGPTDEEKEVKRVFDAYKKERRSKVEVAIESGRLPPLARELFRPDGTINPSFIDGPNGDEDIVRTKDGGRSGPKLTWDLDQDGRISRDERTITERELYDATLGLPSG